MDKDYLKNKIVKTGLKIIDIRYLVSTAFPVELNDKNSFYKGNSGVRGLYRHWGGAWDALWYDGLDLFGDGCRVGRFSAEGSAKKLEEEALGAFSPIGQSLDSVLSLTH